MDPKFGTYTVQQHSDSIVCSQCGKSGKLIWDDVSRLNKLTIIAELAGIDGPFFERLSKLSPYPIELVCRACGGVAATTFPMEEIALWHPGARP